MFRVRAHLAWWLLAASGQAGCGPLPAPGPGRALYVDLEQIVSSRERTEWVIDRVELEDAAPEIMRSACPTPPAQRAALASWLDERLAGGPSAEARWRAAAEALDSEMHARLHLERLRAVLRYAEARAEECPFWLRGDPAFAGVHTEAGRFVVQAETMGGFQLVFVEGLDAEFGGGGMGRLLVGGGLDHRLTVLGGLEMGLASVLDRGAAGEVTLTPAFALGLPLVLRVASGALRWDTGVALIGRSADPDFSDPRFGLRWDQSIGVATLRVAGVQPFVMVWAGHEWLPETEEAPGQHGIRLGSRVGFTWDP